MGIHGLLREIGPGARLALSALSASHYATHARPLRIAIDISIWLFQIQAGRGGSNPALRTFYYRLLRLLLLNIHPLFVFDGPNKPLFKRNKKVGGPGVRVATVPEFLAKQVLKQFGFPVHVAPGEAEAECALLEREGVVDAVLSEDVDTLMFGCGTTLRQWTSEGSTKTPTHVNVYRASETEAKSRLTKEGMVLVALMSGGDYIPEGIPGCGPKVACDAARAGFGKDLCALRRSDRDGLKAWRERLQHEIRTNESKFFARKKTNFTVPEHFPNVEVLGYYTRPCVSTPQKVAALRESLSWDASIDYSALRTFTAEAFDWRNLGGAKKYIRNLAPALLVRALRLAAENNPNLSPEAQTEAEANLVKAIHGKRNHYTADGALEYRISFTPSTLVPIDLSIEPEDDEFLPAGREDSDSDGDVPRSTPTPGETSDSEAPDSPSKKRQARPYDPDAPEKLWILKDFLQLGCPALVEEYEASLRDPKALFKQRRTARAAGTKGKAAGGRKKKDATGGMEANALMKHVRITKPTTTQASDSEGADKKAAGRPTSVTSASNTATDAPTFKLPSTQIPAPLLDAYLPPASTVPHPLTTARPSRQARSTANFFAPFTASATQSLEKEGQRTPNRRKRRSPDLSTPRPRAGRDIATYFSPTPKKAGGLEVVDLLSSSPAKPAHPQRPEEASPSPPLRHRFIRSLDPQEDAVGDGVEAPGTVKRVQRREEDMVRPLPASVTKRRRKAGLRKSLSAPVRGEVSPGFEPLGTGGEGEEGGVGMEGVEFMDLANPSPPKTRITGAGDPFREVRVTRMASLREKGGPRLPTSTSAGQNEEVLDLTKAPTSSLSTPPAEDAEKRDRSAARAGVNDEVDRDSEHDNEEFPIITGVPPLRAIRRKITTTATATSARTFIDKAPKTRSATSSRSTSATTTAQLPATTSTTHHAGPSAPAPTPTFKLPSATSASEKPAVKKAKTKRHIELRPSLDGCWKETEVEELDLTGDQPSQIKGKAARERRWRASGVDVLDLTGE